MHDFYIKTNKKSIRSDFCFALIAFYDDFNNVFYEFDE